MGNDRSYRYQQSLFVREGTDTYIVVEPSTGKILFLPLSTSLRSISHF